MNPIDKIYDALVLKVESGEITEDQFDSLFAVALEASFSEKNANVIEESFKNIFKQKKEHKQENENGVYKPNKFKQKLERHMEKKNRVNSFLHIVKRDNVVANIKTVTIECSKDKATEIRMLEENVRRETDFTKYRKSFEQLIGAFGITIGNGAVDIISIKVKPTKDDSMVITLKYGQVSKPIELPGGYAIYHSTANKLQGNMIFPSFKGKSLDADGKPKMNGRGELYSYPRVYFSIRKIINPILSANKAGTERKLYSPISYPSKIYLDPHVPSLLTGSQGAVFIETKTPIRCREVAKNSKVEESVSGEIGKFLRNREGKKTTKKTWEKIQSSMKFRKTVAKKLSDVDYKKAREFYRIMCDAELYPTYKHAFDAMCRLLDIPNTSVLEIFVFEPADNVVGCRYSVENRKRFIITNGTRLYHKTGKADLRELKPTFRSKTRGSWFYPTPRVYFSAGKEISDHIAGSSGGTSYSYTYTPKENMTVAYIDPAAPRFKDGAIYIDTKFPIPVMRIK